MLETNFTICTILCKGVNWRKKVFPLETPRSLCRNCLRCSETAVWLRSPRCRHSPYCGPGWPGTGWAWHIRPPSGGTCHHLGNTEEGAQHRRKKVIRKGLKGRTAWLLGALLLVGQESTSGKGAGRSELALLHECHGSTSTVPRVCHWLDSLPSLGRGAQEAVFPLLVPVGWQLSWSQESGQDLGDQPGHRVLWCVLQNLALRRKPRKLTYGQGMDGVSPHLRPGRCSLLLSDTLFVFKIFSCETGIEKWVFPTFPIPLQG